MLYISKPRRHLQWLATPAPHHKTTFLGGGLTTRTGQQCPLNCQPWSPMSCNYSGKNLAEFAKCHASKQTEVIPWPEFCATNQFRLHLWHLQAQRYCKSLWTCPNSYSALRRKEVIKNSAKKCKQEPSRQGAHHTSIYGMRSLNLWKLPKELV